MCEGCSRCGVCQVISRDVYSLDRRDGTILRRSNTFLHRAHFRSQGRLVTYSGRHATKQGRHFRTSLRETEDIVDKEQNICSFSCFCSTISERFCNGKSRKCHRCTCSGRFIHLTIDQSRLAFGHFVIVYFRKIPLTAFHCFGKGFSVFHDARFNHFAQQVVTFTSTLTDTCEYRKAIVSLRNIINELHDKYGLTYAGATKESDLTTFHIRFQEVDYFDTGVENLTRGLQIFELGWFAVDRISITFARDLMKSIDGVSNHVQHATFDLVTNGH